MRDAARFCEANNFYWDGAITEGVNLREWLYENAQYQLLDFLTIIGGQFALYPTVPFDNEEIDKKGKLDIRALFTDSNIKDQ